MIARVRQKLRAISCSLESSLRLSDTATLPPPPVAIALCSSTSMQSAATSRAVPSATRKSTPTPTPAPACVSSDALLATTSGELGEHLGGGGRWNGGRGAGRASSLSDDGAFNNTVTTNATCTRPLSNVVRPMYAPPSRPAAPPQVAMAQIHAIPSRPLDQPPQGFRLSYLPNSRFTYRRTYIEYYITKILHSC